MHAFVDHGVGVDARRGALALTAACKGAPSAGVAHAALLAALSASTPTTLRLDGVAVFDVANGPPAADAPEPETPPALKAPVPSHCRSSNTFHEEWSSHDYSVHSGRSRGDDSNGCSPRSDRRVVRVGSGRASGAE